MVDRHINQASKKGIEGEQAEFRSERTPTIHTHMYFGKSGGTQVREDKRARRRGVTRRGASPLLQRNCRKSVGRRRRTSRTRRDAPFRGPAIKYRPLVISCASPLVPPFLELERWRNSINFKSRRREKSNEII